jgi:methylthioribose-1-phosphate isomerase
MTQATTMTSTITPIRRDARGRVVMLDQRRLPFEEIYLTYETGEAVAGAIRDMVIRGAPAIGVAAAMGLALGARRLTEADFAAAFPALCEVMAASRPTAVNLFWAIDRIKALVGAHEGSLAALQDALDREAQRVYDEDIAINRAMGAHGAELFPEVATVLTHCNTGGLATAGWGTALGVVRSAIAAGKRVAVFADETRPYLQGSRLTAWECLQDGIDVTVLADGAAGHLLASGRVDVAVVGADRIAHNGDAANKIGTYMVATLCARHGVPFYVVAPTSTVDLAIPDGAAIPIEQRPAEEVTEVFGKPIAPSGVKVFNPSFDVTPAELITGIVTEHGVARAPYDESLPVLVARAGARR